jgi:hypothetical protein
MQHNALKDKKLILQNEAILFIVIYSKESAAKIRI